MSINYIHLPAFPSLYISPKDSFVQREGEKRKISAQMEVILDYLAEEDPNPLFDDDSCCVHTLYDNSACNLLTYSCKHALTIVKDATIGSCWRSRKPSHITRSYVTEEFHETTAQATKDFHSNLFGLFVVAMVVQGIASFTVDPPPALVFVAAVCTLYYAGLKTYVFSGDFGVQNVDGRLVLGSGIRLEATKNYEKGFENLSLYLSHKWEVASQYSEEAAKIHHQVQLIVTRNWDHLINGMRHAKISERAIKAILAPFAKTIIDISQEYGRLFPMPQNPFEGRSLCHEEPANGVSILLLGEKTDS
jgi:hypothetical protein